MSFDLLGATLAPYVMLIVIGFLPSEVWRVLAIFLSRSLNEDSEIIVWVRAVSTALLTGVVASIVLAPTGALLLVPLWARVGSVLAGLAAYMLLRRSVLAAVVTGEACVIAAAWAYGV